MRSSNRRLWLTTAFIICRTRSLGSTDVEYWGLYIKSHSTQQIAAEMKTGTIPWPRLTGLATDTRVLEQERQLALAFVSICDAEYSLPNLLSLPERLRNYSQMISAIRRSGGYLNAVLLDVVFRMALTDLAITAINNPERAGDQTKLFGLLQPGPWKAAEIGRLLAAQLHKPGLTAEFAQWPETELLERIMKTIEADSRVLPPSSSNAKSSALIGRVSMRDLVFRIAETEMVYAYSLPGLIAYVARGGKLDALTAQDVSALDAVMGSERLNFKFPLMRIRLLRGIDVVEMSRMFETRPNRPPFLEIALS
jgi:hypothetical protein